jgi:hypothetical protein
VKKNKKQQKKQAYSIMAKKWLIFAFASLIKLLLKYMILPFFIFLHGFSARIGF